MRQRDSLIPNFAQVFEAAIGSVTTTPVMPVRPAAGPIDREIRRINSAHKPEVREVASDNEIGRDIVEADARQLAAQKRSVRKNAQRPGPSGSPVKPPRSGTE
jgi:hypothetical protein